MTAVPDPLEHVDPLAVLVAPSPRSDAGVARRERLRVLLHSKTFLAGAFLMLVWIVCAIFGEALVPGDPFKEDLLDKLASPSADHWFGTDRIGRDIFARVVVGARDVLIVAPAAALLGTVLGTALGLVTGYFRGWVDDIISRLVDAFLAIPLIIVALLAIAAVGGSSWTLIIVIGIVFAPIIGRTVRAAVLAERDLDYVAAARLRNEKAPYIMFAEILPNVLAPVIVEFTVRLGYAIFTIMTLSFLGFGIPPPSPNWGAQIAEHYGFIGGGDFWPTLFPALAVTSLVIAANLIADGIAQAFER